jgi:hypothetical protein
MKVGDREKTAALDAHWQADKSAKLHMLINNPVTILDLSWKQPRFSKEERINRLLPVVVPENANDWQALFTYTSGCLNLHFIADA